MKKHDPEKMGRLLAAGGVILSLAAAVVSLLRNPQEEGEEQEEAYAPPAPGTREYRGYVPTGCRACGGPYPVCRLGCSAFDDD